MTDWDAIQSMGGFTVGDQVRHRAPDVGFIRNLIDVKGRIRARVRWPTVPFESEGVVCSIGCEQFVDIDKLTKVIGEPRGQMDMFEAGNHGW